MTPDQINGLFELIGSVLICLSIRRLYLDRRVRGVSVVPITFFSMWGWWNLYFYPFLGQWWSFIGGLFMVTVNTIWLVQMGYYLFLEKTDEPLSA